MPAVNTMSVPVPHTRSAMVPGAGNAAEDAILLARLAAVNMTPFTAQHGAAYAAFTGITDRKTAMRLHRAHVHWDDVHAYDATGLIDPAHYDLMVELRTAGLKPSRVVKWRDLLERYRFSGPFIIESIQSLHSTGKTPTQVEPYLVEATRPGAVPWTVDTIVLLVRHTIDPQQARQWVAIGVLNPALMASLNGLECSPAFVSPWVTSTLGQTQAPITPTDFERAYRPLFLVAQHNSRLAQAALVARTEPALLRAWLATGCDPTRIGLYLLARIGLDEWLNEVTVREMPEDTLATLAGMYGDSHIT